MTATTSPSSPPPLPPPSGPPSGPSSASSPGATPGPDPGQSGPGRHTARWAAIVVGIVELLFVGLLATRKSADRAHADSPLLGRQAPVTTGPSIAFTGASDRTPGAAGTGAGPSSLAAFKGKYVLVN